MKEDNRSKLLTREAYNASAAQFAKNTEHLHPKEFAQKFLALLPGPKILDLGCGPGRDALAFVEQGFQVTGVDLSPSMIEMAKAKVDAQFYVMDIENLDFPPHSFHGVWASASLLHIPKRKLPDVLKSLSSLLVDKGVLYMSLKRGCSETVEPDPRYGNVQKFWSFFEKEEIEHLVRQASFQIIESVETEKPPGYQGHPQWINIIAQGGDR